MCMEDVLLGRDATEGQIDYSVGAVSQQLIGFDSKRFSIIISPPIANTLTISMTNPAVAGIGINITPTSPPLILNIKDHGMIVTRPLFAIGSGAGTNGSIWYTSLAKSK